MTNTDMQARANTRPYDPTQPAAAAAVSASGARRASVRARETITPRKAIVAGSEFTLLEDSATGEVFDRFGRTAEECRAGAEAAAGFARSCRDAVAALAHGDVALPGGSPRQVQRLTVCADRFGEAAERELQYAAAIEKVSARRAAAKGIG